MKPTEGRIVHFYPEDRKNKPGPWPAVITHVEDADKGIVNLHVFSDAKFGLPNGEKCHAGVPQMEAVAGEDVSLITKFGWAWPPIPKHVAEAVVDVDTTGVLKRLEEISEQVDRLGEDVGKLEDVVHGETSEDAGPEPEDDPHEDMQNDDPDLP